MQKRIRTRLTSSAVKVQHSNLSEPFREKLPNGVTVIGESILSVQSIAIGVWVNFGSRDEKKEENGLTHLVEHMVFKGTADFTAEEIVENIEGRGGYINAFTTKESSCYYAKIFKEDLETTIKVLSDLVLSPKFDERDLRNERKVVLSEMQEVYDDPEDWGMDFVEEKIFAGNSLSMPIIGRASLLKGFIPGDLHRFHSKNFTADRIIISAAGSFEQTNLVNLAEKYFSAMEASPKIFLRRKPSLNPGGNFVVHRDTGKQAHILLAARAPGLNDQDRFAASMVGVILGDGSSSRLHKNIREKDGLAYSIYSFGSAYSDCGILGIYVCTAVNDVDRAEDRIHTTISDFLKNGPTEGEVVRAKAQLKAGIIFSLENLWDRAALFARDEFYYRGRSNLSESLASIERVTAVEITEAAMEYLKKDNITSVKVLPMNSKVERRSRNKERKSKQ
ncbi:MAG TPA: pitrilysin family protein [Candidatus Acidoferrales bacterium]|nr:pitrilysin family protein [Candidatus Acidoferrales bacterium]